MVSATVLLHRSDPNIRTKSSAWVWAIASSTIHSNLLRRPSEVEDVIPGRQVWRRWWHLIHTSVADGFPCLYHALISFLQAISWDPHLVLNDGFLDAGKEPSCWCLERFGERTCKGFANDRNLPIALIVESNRQQHLVHKPGNFSSKFSVLLIRSSLYGIPSI